MTIGQCSHQAQRIAGDATSHCPVNYMINIRVMTLNPEPEPEGRYHGQRWDSAVRLQLAFSKTVYENECIHIRLAERVNCPVDLSREILTRSIHQDAENDPQGGSYDQRLESLERNSLRRYQSCLEAGHVIPSLAEGQYALRLADQIDSEHGSNDIPNDQTRYVASNETINLLHYNRDSNDISVYFVPIIDGRFGSRSGQAMISTFWSNVQQNLEGIIISSGARYDTLAHELGHFLMRIGHYSLEGPRGKEEGSAPETNIMHGNGEHRIGMTLTDGQRDALFYHGRQLGYIQMRHQQ